MIKSVNLFILFLVLIFQSCDKNRIFEENKKIPDGIWQADFPVKFEFDVNDTISLCNFYVNVRHTAEYPFSNLFLFIKTDFPNGQSAQDTLECQLQNRNGKWVGDGMGDIVDAQLVFKKGMRFPLKGKYSFTYNQAMRVPRLPMVMEMGLRIEKNTKE